MSKRKSTRLFSVEEALQMILGEPDDDLVELVGEENLNEADDESEQDESDVEIAAPNVDNIVENDIPVGLDHARRREVRPVHSLESSFEDENYDQQVPALLSPSIESSVDDTTYTWVASEVSRGRRPAADTLFNRPGPRHGVANITEPLDIWMEFITAEITLETLEHTNNKVRDFHQNLSPEVLNDSRYTYFKEIEEEELYAFFGFMYARGLLNQNLVDQDKLFNENIGHPIFSAIFSRNRFMFIKRMLCFDNHDTRHERWQTDRFAAFRGPFEIFNKNCARNMAADDLTCIDETLYPTRMGVKFKTYNKDKPAKYGINFRSLGSSRRPYIYYTIPYSGKPEIITDTHIADTLTLVKRIVTGYCQEGHPLVGCNISMDRYYTSIPLAEWLYDQKITCIGTMNVRRKGIPTEMKETKSREPFSWAACKDENSNIIINSYVVQTKKKKKKNVLLLQTTPASHCVTKDEKKKPMVYKIYDYTKGGVDIPDQRMGSYTTKFKSRKWTLVLLAYVLDVARVNSQTVMAFNKGVSRVDSFKFAWDLMMSLATPHMLNRLGTVGISKKLRASIMTLTGQEPPLPGPLLDAPTKKSTCAICRKGLHGAGYKKNKDKLHVVKTFCKVCHRHVCSKHYNIVCEECGK